MKRWLLTGSVDGNEITFDRIIYQDTEPSFWQCYNMAAARGCPYFTLDEMEPGPVPAELKMKMEETP